MASPLPTPVAAALGLVPAVLSRARRLPGQAVQLPFLALSTFDTFRREYDALADRGERLVARLSGRTVEVADEAGDVLVDLTAEAGGTAREAAGFASHVVDAAVETVAAGAATASDTATDTDTDTDTATEPAADAPQEAEGAPDQPDVPSAEQPKGVPTPRAVEPDSTRVDTAATPDVVDVVEQAVQTAAAAGGAAAGQPAHDELPLPDYDHMTLGSLRGRLRSLDVPQLVQVRAYEKAHADRLPVVTMLDNRIAKLSTDPSATPSGPVSTAPAPEQQAVAGTPARTLSPATTNAPKINPPSQGDPTNPAQPR